MRVPQLDEPKELVGEGDTPKLGILSRLDAILVQILCGVAVFLLETDTQLSDQAGNFRGRRLSSAVR